jgi:hypothetical protein
VLENEIIPAYYNRNEAGVSPQWVTRVKNTIANIAPRFTMKRMMDDYHHKFYRKLHDSHNAARANDFVQAKAVAQWKEEVRQAWGRIEVVRKEVFNFDNDPLPLGEPFRAELVLDIQDLRPEDVGVELLIAKQHEGKHEIILVKEFDKKRLKKKALAGGTEGNERRGTRVKYVCDEKIPFSGVYDYGFRVFAQRQGLAHRQELGLVKWV